VLGSVFERSSILRPTILTTYSWDEMSAEAFWSKLWDTATWPNRWRKSQVGIARWLADRGLILFLFDIVLYLATAVWARDAGKALEIAIGTISPFVTRADAVAVPLAMLSWLLIPALTGAIIAVIVDTELRRYNLTKEQMDKRIDTISQNLAKLVGEEG